MSDFLKYFLPTHEFDNLFAIDKNIFLNKELIIFDVDNTIFISETTESPQEVIQWFINLSKEHPCIFVSNSHSISRRMSVIIEKTGCEFYISKRKKPSRKLFTELCNKKKVNPNKVVVVGDRLFTDILFGNLNQATTILVKPLSSKEYLFIKLFRFTENLFLKIIKLFSHYDNSK